MSCNNATQSDSGDDSGANCAKAVKRGRWRWQVVEKKGEDSSDMTMMTWHGKYASHAMAD